jgi:hypothetical protein
MTIKNKVATLFAVGTFASAVAARAQGAMVPDPNLAPSTSAAEATLPGTPENRPELAAIPDPNLAPPFSGAEGLTPDTIVAGPELAMIPDPNLAPEAVDNGTEIQHGLLGVHALAPSDTPDATPQ